MRRFCVVAGASASIGVFSRRSWMLGFAGIEPDNGAMTKQAATDQHASGDGKGFVFPGVFEITALGPASANLATEIPRLLVSAGLNILPKTVASRPSSAGRFVSETISFRAESRADYDAAHEALRAHPEVKWTL